MSKILKAIKTPKCESPSINLSKKLSHGTNLEINLIFSIWNHM
jgi:hypothetical protein